MCERALREIYLPAFEAAVKEARVGAIMDGYNLTNGLYMSLSFLLRSLALVLVGAAGDAWGLRSTFMFSAGLILV